MPEAVRVWVGELRPPIFDRLTYIDPDTGEREAIDLTDCVVKLCRRPVHSTAPEVCSDATVVDAAEGRVQYDWQAGETDTPGEFVAWWEITFPTESEPQGSDEFGIDFEEHAADIPTGDLTLPCAAWIDSDDIDRACQALAGQVVDLPNLARVASEVLYHLSGEQFNGVCSRTIRPGDGRCGCWAWRWHYDSRPGGWGIASTCGCWRDSTLWLPDDNVVAVQSVTIDGAAFVDWRLDGNRLVRTDGAAWPACQDFSADVDEAGAFVVTYTHGVPPPLAGQLAAAELACYLAQSAPALGVPGARCDLPKGTKAISRQGITIQIAGSDATVQFGVGMGLVLVDAFLASYNPDGWRRPPSVWHPLDRQTR